MTRLIEWDGEPFALLVETPRGNYLVPPIVFDLAGNVIEGHDALAAIATLPADHPGLEIPTLRNRDAGDLAEVDRRMAQLSAELGVPINPPD